MMNTHADSQGPTDSALAVAASRGDDAAFATLYARYAPRIEGYLARLLGDRHLAEDVTHEVFVSALRRLRQDRPPIAFGPWMFRIARNAAIDVHRRAQLARHVPLGGQSEDLGPGGDAPEEAAEVRQRISLLLGALDGLTESHRNVLVLRELEGLSNGEIAERLGITRPAVEALLFRARGRVRREYDELVSGRRCQRVRRFLDSAGGGGRLGRRELDVAARHMRSCRECRRHAWEAGVTTLVLAESSKTAAMLPLPALAVALAGRGGDLARNLLVPWSAAPPVSAPVGRALALIGVVALGVGAGEGQSPSARAQVPSAPLVAQVDAGDAASEPIPLAAGPPAHHAHRRAAERAAAPRVIVVPQSYLRPVARVSAPAPPRPAPVSRPEGARRHLQPSPEPRAEAASAVPEPSLEKRVAVAVPEADAAVEAGARGASVRAGGAEAGAGPPEAPPPPGDGLPAGA